MILTIIVLFMTVGLCSFYMLVRGIDIFIGIEESKHSVMSASWRWVVSLVGIANIAHYSLGALNGRVETLHLGLMLCVIFVTVGKIISGDKVSTRTVNKSN